MKTKHLILIGALLLGVAVNAQNTEVKTAEILSVIKPPIEQTDRTPVVFTQQENGFKLAGILYRPRTWKQGEPFRSARRAEPNSFELCRGEKRSIENERLKAIIVDGPMYSVKEQTQSIYAQLLAQAGYVTLVFDHSYIGSSEGYPRGYEDPEIKGADLRSAVSYLETLDFIDKSHIGAVGICGSGVYVPNGLRNDRRVKAIASIVPFIMMEDIRTHSDAELLKMKATYEKGEEVQRLDLIKGGEGEAYYRNPDRGATVQACPTPAWSQLAWHKFHPTETVKELKVPYLVIAGEKAFTTAGAKKLFENAPEPKFFHLTKDATHFEMYDIDKYVKENVGELLSFFGKYL